MIKTEARTGEPANTNEWNRGYEAGFADGRTALAAAPAGGAEPVAWLPDWQIASLRKGDTAFASASGRKVGDNDLPLYSAPTAQPQPQPEPSQEFNRGWDAAIEANRLPHGAERRQDHDWRPRELQEEHGEVTLPFAEFKRLVAAQPERLPYCSALDPAMQAIKAQPGLDSWRYEAKCDGVAAQPEAPAEPPTPVAQQPAELTDEWYLQDTRTYVGNDVSWWAKDGKGYTTDISKAHVYTREAAFRQAAMRGCDRAWPKAYIDGKTRPAVDMQYIDHAEAIKAQGGGQ